MAERELKQWEEVPELVTVQLSELVADLKEIEEQIADLEERKVAIRALIEPSIQKLGDEVTVECNGRLLAWHEPSTTERLDKGKLVAAGVTPAQLKAGTVVGSKKGYFDVRKVERG